MFSKKNNNNLQIVTFQVVPLPLVFVALLDLLLPLHLRLLFVLKNGDYIKKKLVNLEIVSFLKVCK